VTTYRFGIVYENTQGHVTFASTLKEAVGSDPQIEAQWIPLSHEPRDRLERLPPFGQNLSMLMAVQARRSLRKSGPKFDALLFHTQQTALLSRSIMSDVPTVLSVDATPKNIDELGAPYGHRVGSMIEEEFKRRMTTRIMTQAALVVPWSEWCRRSIIDDYGIAPERIRTIPAGINLSRWRVRDRRTPGPLRLLFVGAQFERKGGWVLLRALEALSGDWELDAVTKSTELPDDPRIRVRNDLMPNDSRLVELFRRADIFVFPTLGDASPFVVLEAMAAGLPIATTTVGAIPEMLGGEQGASLIPPNDHVALCATLQRLSDDESLRDALGLAARSRVEERYDASHNAESILREMKNLSDQRRDLGR
jgi:glycosyltransferase involved in cell wall biosynthesis